MRVLLMLGILGGVGCGIALGQDSKAAVPAAHWADAAAVSSTLPAINPPPISLTLKDESLSNVVEAVNKKLGGNKFKLFFLQPPSTPTYTIDVDHGPLWAVFDQVAKQHRIWMVDGASIAPLDTGAMKPLPGGLGISDRGDDGGGAGKGFTHGVISAGFLLTPESWSYVRKTVPGTPETDYLELQYRIYADPRIVIVRGSEPRIVEAQDDAGNLLVQTPGGNAGTAEGRELVHARRYATRLRVPEKMGTRASLKIVVPYTVQLAGEKQVINDLSTHVGEAVTFAGDTVKIERFITDSNSLSMSLGLSEGNREMPIRLRLVDSKGASVTVNPVVNNLLKRPFVEPFNLELEATTSSVDVGVPFELKDLPLPQ